MLHTNPNPDLCAIVITPRLLLFSFSAHPAFELPSVIVALPTVVANTHLKVIRFVVHPSHLPIQRLNLPVRRVAEHDRSNKRTCESQKHGDNFLVRDLSASALPLHGNEGRALQISCRTEPKAL